MMKHFYFIAEITIGKVIMNKNYKVIKAVPGETVFQTMEKFSFLPEKAVPVKTTIMTDDVADNLAEEYFEGRLETETDFYAFVDGWIASAIHSSMKEVEERCRKIVGILLNMGI